MPPADPASPPSPVSPPSDDAMARYLATVELDSLDLRGLELPEASRGPSRVSLWACAAGALVNGIGTLLFPWTVTYQLRSYGESLFFALLGVEALLLVLLARIARAFVLASASSAQQAGGPAARAEATVVTQAEDGTWIDPSQADEVADLSWSRVLTEALEQSASWRAQWSAWLSQYRVAGLFALVFVLGTLLVFVLPREAQWSGGTYSVLWFVTVAVATGTGILVGRFIMAAGETARPANAEPLPPIVFPPWMRWFNLGLLCVGGLVATFGPGLWRVSGPSGDFGFAIVGLITGISGAIWIARRFDEWEADFRQQAEQKGRSTPDEGHFRPLSDAGDDAPER